MLVVKRGVQLDDGDLVLVETLREATHIIVLEAYESRPDNQDDGNDELHADERHAQPLPHAGEAEATLQREGGRERHHVIRRVKPRHETRRRGDRARERHHRQVLHQRQVRLDERERLRAPQEINDEQAQPPSEQADDHRLREEHPPQRRVGAAQHLPDVDALDAQRGERRAEIRIVDGRHHDDEERHAQQQEGHLAVATAEDATVARLVPIINVRERRQLDALIRCLDLREIEMTVEIVRHVRGRGRVVQQKITYVVARREIIRIAIRVNRRIDGVRELRVLRQVGVHATDGERRRPVRLCPDRLLRSQRPPHGGLALAKKLIRQAPRHDYLLRVGQASGVALHEREAKHPGQRGVAGLHVFLEAHLLATSLHRQVGTAHERRGDQRARLDVRRRLDDLLNKTAGQDDGEKPRLAQVDPEQAVGRGIAAVEVPLEAYLDQDRHEGGERHGEPRHVEEHRHLMTAEQTV